MRPYQALLQIEVSRGMFDHERGISFCDTYGDQVQGIFPISMIRDGRLEVLVIEEKGETVHIEAARGPGYELHNRGRVWVPKGLVSRGTTASRS